MIIKERLKTLLEQKETEYEKYEDSLNEGKIINQYEEDDNNIRELYRLEGSIDVLKLLIKEICKEKHNYLSEHFRYSILNSWNNLDSFARNVKIYNIINDNELREKAYEVLSDEEYYVLWKNIQDMLDSFSDIFVNYEIIWNGRNNGYLVLKYKDTNTSIEVPDEDDEFAIENLYKIVVEFNKIVDKGIEEFINYLKGLK